MEVAEKRMLSKVISVSEKINTLPDIFDMLLFTWMIPHTDDFGRLAGSPAKVKALVVPMLDKTVGEVSASLERLKKQGVILWYEVDGEKIIEIVDSDRHQNGLKSKKQKFRSPNSHLTSSNSYLSASEADIEEFIAEKLMNNEFFEGEQVLSVERQLRIDNSYLDILATCQSGKRYLFEIKRQRLSNAAIEQILKYRAMLKDPNVQCFLIGNGLASNFDIQKCDDERINVLVYDDALYFDAVMLFDVNYRDLLLLSNRTELNRTEQNITEEKRTEQEPEPQAPSGGSPDVNLFRLFENEGFGTISSVTSDKIQSLERDYGNRWVVEAMKIAVLKGKRNLAFVVGILKNWQSGGIDEPWTQEKKREQNRRQGNSGKPDIPIVQHKDDDSGLSEKEMEELLQLAEQMGSNKT
jgi:DnaD/phage-associated family protein